MAFSDTQVNIKSHTYTHDDLRDKWFHLDELLDRMEPISSIPHNNVTPTISNVGTLNALPNELLLEVFDWLSITDVMRFRRCNRYWHHFIDTIPSVRTVLHVAPNAIKGILALKVSSHITAKHLCDTVKEKNCAGCGMLAQSIYLPICVRACFECLHPSNTTYFDPPIPEDQALLISQLEPQDLATRPHFRSLPCTFTNGVNEFQVTDRHTMYHHVTVALDQKLASKPSSKPTAETVTNGAKKFRAAIFQGGASRFLQQDRDQQGVVTVREPIPRLLQLHMASVIAPWPSSTKEEAEHGIFCSGCQRGPLEMRLYTEETFMEHLKEGCVGPDADSEEVDWEPLLWLCEEDEEDW